MTNRIKIRTPFIFGTVLILLGGALAARNLNLMSAELSRIIISWQTLLIFIGIIGLFTRHLLSGVILITVGSFFLIPKLSGYLPIPENFVSLFWPVLLICFGILMIFCRMFGVRHKHCRPFHHHQHHGRHWHHCSGSSEHGQQNRRQDNECNVGDDFHKVNVFGHGEYFVIDSEFTGGTLTCVFGGMEVDLRKAILPEGETFLKIEAVFSGITLFIPDEWIVETRLDAVASGVEEERRKSTVASKDRRLILCGSTVFSGIEIKH